MKSYGFIGCGNMGSALARAICRRIDAKQLYLSNRDPDKAEKLAMELHANVSDRVSIAKECDCIFLGVIPQAMEKLLADIRPFLQERKKAPLLVSMAASLTIGEIGEMAGGNVPVVRIMPNTPVSVGEGVILYACGDRAGPKKTEQLINVLEAAGLCMEMQEERAFSGAAMDAVIAAYEKTKASVK